MHATITIFVAALVIAVLVLRPRPEGFLLNFSKFESPRNRLTRKVKRTYEMSIRRRCNKSTKDPSGRAACINRLLKRRSKNPNWKNKGGWFKVIRNKGHTKMSKGHTKLSKGHTKTTLSKQHAFKQSIATRCGKFTDPTQKTECVRKLVQKRSQNPNWLNLGGYALN